MESGEFWTEIDAEAVHDRGACRCTTTDRRLAKTRPSEGQIMVENNHSPTRTRHPHLVRGRFLVADHRSVSR
jgi:hypothetical protein